VFSQLGIAYRHLVISEKVPDDISDCWINVFHKTPAADFKFKSKYIKNNIWIENQKLRITEQSTL